MKKDKDLDLASESVVKKLPSKDIDIHEDNLNEFFNTMLERQNIWYRRFILNKKAPWTKDEILKNYKFTNVYRELDRNTQWQINNIFLNFKSENDKKELLWQLMVFRFFNQPEFFEFIGEITQSAFDNKYEEYGFVGKMIPYDKFNSDILKEFLDRFRVENKNPFTNAYCTNTVVCKGFSRDHCFAYTVIPSLHGKIPELLEVMEKADKPERIIKLILSLPSVSNFMAHEFYQDFTYTPRYCGFDLMKFNQDDFTNIGPGAELGIRLIFPNIEDKKGKIQAIYNLRDLAVEYLDSIGNFKFLGYDNNSNSYFYNKKDKKITLHQIEMWLCEYQKYWKMKVGEGKQRSTFKPRD